MIEYEYIMEMSLFCFPAEHKMKICCDLISVHSIEGMHLNKSYNIYYHTWITHGEGVKIVLQ